jgi:putative membrane-bound dehydrogenase-like protein
MLRLNACLFVFCLNAVGLSAAVGQTANVNNLQDSADKDYSAELPRLPPRLPSEALAAIEVLDGFKVQLVAAEPLVTDPVAFAFDARGRLFVVEMRDYSEQETEHLGRIALLTDINGDGVMDQRTTFVEGLSWPTAVWPWRDGILVAEPPRVTWYRDADDNGLSEQSEDWMVGFGRGNVQGLVNSLRWGVDGYIHGATSSAGADLELKATSSTSVNLGRRDFAIDPLTQTVEPESGGGQHGMSFNRWGDKFMTSNSDHLQQVISLDHWLSKHPSEVSLPATRRSIAEDGPQAEVFRASPIEPWRIVRTRLRVSGVAPGIVEGGGRAAGYFTGATGTWLVDEEFDFGDGSDTALVCDVGSNLIHRKRMLDHGLFWSGQRIDEGTELLRSSDTWFRPVQLGDGPDGAIYIADMAREVIEHPKSLPPMIKQHLDLTSGRDRGRIWKLTRSNHREQQIQPNLAILSSTELVSLLGHRIPWQRRMASQLLVERADKGAKPAILAAVASAQVPEARLLALHVAERLGWFHENLAKLALRDKHERVLEHALQLIEKAGIASSCVAELTRLASQADSPRVQLALAQVSAELDEVARFAILRPLLPVAKDELVRAVIATAAGKQSWKLVQDSAANDHSSWLSLLLPVWTKQIGAEPLDAWLRQQIQTDNPQLAIWLDALCELPNRSDANRVLSVLSDAERGRLFDGIESRLDPSAQSNQLVWISLLPENVQTRWLMQGLVPSASEDTQQAVIRGLAWANHPQLAEQLITRFKSLTPAVQQNALRFLTSRAPALEQLASALEQKLILSAHVPADVRQRLLSDRNADLALRFQSCLSGVSEDRVNVIHRYAQTLEENEELSTKGSSELAKATHRGRDVFSRVCAQCHQLGDIGNDVGPPLKSLVDKSPQQLLETILDPNREVDPKYASYTILLEDGRALAGIIREETSTQILLAEAGGKVHRISRDAISELKSNGISFMPVGLEEQVTPEQMVELIAFLRSGGNAPPN